METHDWSYPLVAIDGALKMAGGISFGMITNHLDKLIEEAEVNDSEVEGNRREDL